MVPAEKAAEEREHLITTAREWRERHDEMARGRISVTMEPPMMTVANVRLAVTDVRDRCEREHLLAMVVETIRRQARW
jgi:hypothetical protein